MSKTIFVLRLDSLVGEGVPLEGATPNERPRVYSESQARAVESQRAVMIGDGERDFQPIELVVTLKVKTGRYQLAKELSDLEANLARTVRLEFSPLYFDVTRARVAGHAPIEGGAKVTLRFYGPNHDFIDATDLKSVPLI
jgi:hypothetical protein